MTAGSSLAFPGGRTLAAWWRQLAPLHPEALWVGYLTFHRLEAPVCCQRAYHLPALEWLIVKALGLSPVPVALSVIAGQLHLDACLLRQVLFPLCREGLVTWIAEDVPGLSEAGRRALENGEYLRLERERRTFYFWHADWPLPAGLPSSLFAVVLGPDKLSWLAAPETPFDIQTLRSCIQESESWKERHGFPLEIQELLSHRAGAAPPAWDQVLVAYPQRLFAAVVQTRTASGAVRLEGLAAQTRNWELHAAAPAFVVPDEPPGWFPPPCPEEAWRRAFVEWCQQRELTAEAEHCELTVRDQRLFVNAPAPVMERLRGSKGTAKGETWLLAGEGLVRVVARLEL
jgi:hypothetical protein